MKIKVVMRRGQPPLALEGAMLGAGVNLAAAHLRQREQKRILNYTFEAGMCMKTKDRKTQCPNRNRLIVPRFRHLRRIERYFAENCCFCTTACQVHADFRGFPRVPRSEHRATWFRARQVFSGGKGRFTTESTDPTEKNALGVLPL